MVSFVLYNHLVNQPTLFKQHSWSFCAEAARGMPIIHGYPFRYLPLSALQQPLNHPGDSIIMSTCA